MARCYISVVLSHNFCYFASLYVSPPSNVRTNEEKTEGKLDSIATYVIHFVLVKFKLVFQTYIYTDLYVSVPGKSGNL